jgi:hypothetical protein
LLEEFGFTAYRFTASLAFAHIVRSYRHIVRSYRHIVRSCRHILRAYRA